ncbi:unnamed protein product [Bursaphelenchus okinawaensis]|uniref:Uncharacterized protein n=1 Tax=Bursaphelenchus okinawaensis TaxID=465554 RepID=A0A811KBH3_9BILA|nr:unnamed protein product [Bursaphelenchus okinawaensis]CAG9097367.1 unnamed protein product [Bursaphelenchus okinawaensis]
MSSDKSVEIVKRCSPFPKVDQVWSNIGTWQNGKPSFTYVIVEEERTLVIERNYYGVSKDIETRIDSYYTPQIYKCQRAVVGKWSVNHWEYVSDTNQLSTDDQLVIICTKFKAKLLLINGAFYLLSEAGRVMWKETLLCTSIFAEKCIFDYEWNRKIIPKSRKHKKQKFDDDETCNFMMTKLEYLYHLQPMHSFVPNLMLETENEDIVLLNQIHSQWKPFKFFQKAVYDFKMENIDIEVDSVVVDRKKVLTSKVETGFLFWKNTAIDDFDALLFAMNGVKAAFEYAGLPLHRNANKIEANRSKKVRGKASYHFLYVDEEFSQKTVCTIHADENNTTLAEVLPIVARKLRVSKETLMETIVWRVENGGLRASHVGDVPNLKEYNAYLLQYLGTRYKDYLEDVECEIRFAKC